MPMLTASVVSALLEKMDDRRTLVPWDDILDFEKAWLKLDPETTGEIPRWKLKGLCNLLLEGEVERGLRRAFSLGLILTKPMSQGGVTFDILYKLLDESHKEHFEKFCEDKKGTKDELDAETKQREGVENQAQFRYELVLQGFVAIHALGKWQAVQGMKESLHRLFTCVDRLYSRVTYEHLHRMLNAMNHIEQTIREALHGDGLKSKGNDLQEEPLGSFIQKSEATMKSYSPVRRHSYSDQLSSDKTVTKTQPFSAVLRVLRSRIFMHIGKETQRSEQPTNASPRKTSSKTTHATGSTEAQPPEKDSTYVRLCPYLLYAYVSINFKHSLPHLHFNRVPEQTCSKCNTLHQYQTRFSY